IQRRLQSAPRNRQRAVVLRHGLYHLEILEQIQDLAIAIEIGDWRVLLLELDVLPAEARDEVHPRPTAVEMTDDGASSRLQNAPDLLQRKPGVARVVQHSVRPDSIEALVGERQRENILDTNVVRGYVFELEMTSGEGYSLRSQVGGGHPYAALEELQAVIPQ